MTTYSVIGNNRILTTTTTKSVMSNENFIKAQSNKPKIELFQLFKRLLSQNKQEFFNTDSYRLITNGYNEIQRVETSMGSYTAQEVLTLTLNKLNTEVSA